MAVGKRHIERIHLVFNVLHHLLDVAQVRGVGVHNDDLAHGALDGHDHAVPQHSDKLDDVDHAGHGALQVGVDQRRVLLRDHEVVHGVLLELGGQQRLDGLVDHLGDERGDVADDARHVEEDGEGGGEGKTAVLDVHGALHAAAVHANVPVGKVHDKADDARNDVVQVVLAHLLAHVRQQRLRGGQDPAVHLVRAVDVEGHRTAVTHAQVGVVNEELGSVEQRQQHLLHHGLDAILAEAQRLAADDRGVDYVHAKGIRAVAVDDEAGLGVVLQALGHLLAVLGKDETGDTHVAEGRLVKERDTEHEKSVEPAAGLIETLRDVVGGEALRKALLVLEGVVDLRVRHGAGLEPAVEHLARAAQRRVALALARDGDVVYVLAVDVGDALHARQLLQLRHAADDDHLLPVLAVPDGQRRAPVAVARHVPVAGVGEPVGEAARLHELGHPVRLVVRGEETVVDGLHIDEPRVDGLVQQGRLTAPAEGVAVDNGALVHEVAVRLQHLDDVRVGVLHVAPSEVGHVRREEAVLLDRADERPALLDNAVLQAHAVIVHTEGRCLVHDTGTGLRRHVVVAENAEGRLLALLGKVGKQRHVLAAHEITTLEVLLNDVRLLRRGGTILLLILLLGRIHLRQAALRQVVVALGLGVEHLDVVHVLVDAQAQVGRQRPRRGGPREEVHVRIIARLEGDGQGRVRDVLVVQVRLEVAQRRRAAGRVRHHLEPTVDVVLRVELGEDPPDRLHIVELHRLVVVIEVDPATGALHRLAPLVGVPHDNLLALVIVVANPILEHVVGRLDTELLVDLKLDWQTVTVPAKAAHNVVACLVGKARDDILDGAGENMTVVGETGGERRTVIEGVRLPALRELDRGLEGILFFPHCEDLLFHLGEVELLKVLQRTGDN
ncbi:hypothetical protein STCU_05273 [Strigomonas culicis]|uniref:Uncharacterized protein n=1 Tax=Strigomonas culicis TaxID=28005 RepID=S9VM19_9TRYP|nr:hypothetical protein STCU_05273 [Strigomonas culicis]|eukprot:EPY28156.1 hypothetical protein STCU_05273 [Strigomonas culicis]